MAGEQEPRVFTASPEDRQAEQAEIQQRAHAPSLELEKTRDLESMEDVIIEYGRQLAPLHEYINEIDTWMRQMRLHGIPDVRAYEELRKKLTDSHARASQLHIRVGEIADGLLGAPRELQQKAEMMSTSMRPVFERVEDAFQDALGAHDAWLKQHAGEIPYGRRGNDFGPYVERYLAPEFYDQRVMGLQEQAAGIEEDVDSMRGSTPQQTADALARVEKLHGSLLELDGKTEAPLESRERKSLIGMLDKLRERLAPSSMSEERLPELELLLSPQEYEVKVGELAQQVSEWEKVADTLEAAGKLTKDVRADMLDELRKYPAQLYELDDKAESSETSAGRTALIAALQELRNRLSDEFYVSEKRNPEIAAASAVRDVYHHVKASYASVQHTLTIDQRRELRARIAMLASLVKQAEDERAASVRGAVLASVSRATEHAPAIAHAALWSKR